MSHRRERGSGSQKSKDAKRPAARAQEGTRAPYSFEFKLRLSRIVAEKKATQTEVARQFGISVTTLQQWVSIYRTGGADALRPQPRARIEEQRVPLAREVQREHVVALREAQPELGTRRIRDLLARFVGLGVAETTVRRILHEAGLIEEHVPSGPREHPPRRFERAEPNQLWQSDIFTFLLRRHERLYMTAFMDDHSRFIVAYNLAHHQRSELVIEALERGIAAFGEPREILTDQGRQYTAWRGETDFERKLHLHGIRHIKSRPQHPQTLGKVERFWKTLWDEFLSRTVFADFADCDRRIQLFIHAYNFQRPHQALEGLVPADRFFRAAPPRARRHREDRRSQRDAARARKADSKAVLSRGAPR